MLVPSSDVTTEIQAIDPGMSYLSHWSFLHIRRVYYSCGGAQVLPLGQCALGAAGTVNHQLLRASKYHGKDSVIRTGTCRSSYSGSLPGSQQTLTSIQAVDTPGLHQVKVAAGQTHMNLSLIMGIWG